MYSVQPYNTVTAYVSELRTVARLTTGRGDEEITIVAVLPLLLSQLVHESNLMLL
jgi:hypothetical protein